MIVSIYICKTNPNEIVEIRKDQIQAYFSQREEQKYCLLDTQITDCNELYNQCCNNGKAHSNYNHVKEYAEKDDKPQYLYILACHTTPNIPDIEI